MKRENSETGEADSSDDDGEDYDIDNIKMMTLMRNKQKGLNCEQQCPCINIVLRMRMSLATNCCDKMKQFEELFGNLKNYNTIAGLQL